MKCPHCGNFDDKVVDSRTSTEGDAIRRRRECLKCGQRFTSYEHIEEAPLMVIKKDGRREAFDRKKVLGGILKACEKRPVGVEVLEEAVERIQRDLRKNFDKEVKSKDIGELVMRELRNLDQVAYVRFASVYREFRDINEFMRELKTLLNRKSK